MRRNVLSNSLDEILGQYRLTFTNKQFERELSDVDNLMQVFGVTPELKAQNPQYWGRELGNVLAAIGDSTFQADTR